MNVVYTYIFNKWDWLKPPMKVTPGWKYICFTDEDDPWQPGMPPHTWELRKVDHFHTPKRMQVYYKTHALGLFPDADYVVSIDGSCHIMGCMDAFVERFLKRDYCLMIHPSRNCTYDEAETVIQYGKDSEKVVRRQMGMYREFGLPENEGMVQTGIIGRYNNPKVESFEEAWWEEVEDGSHRDQLSWNFVNWSSPIMGVDYFTQDETQNDYIAVCPHYRKKQQK